MKNQVSIKPALAVASATKGDVLTKSKALSAQLGKPQPALATAQPAQPTTVAQPVKERPQIIEFGKRAQLVTKPSGEQTAYERRSYNRNYHTEQVDLNTVTHLTSHAVNMIRERLLSQLQKMYTERNPQSAEFKCRDIIDIWKVYGPGQSDGIRKVFRELAKQGKVKEVPHEHGRRTTFTYELLELVPAMPAAPAKAQ